LGDALCRSGERKGNTSILDAARWVAARALARTPALECLPNSRRALDGLKDYEEPVAIEVPAEDLRFMTMTPGGENPRPEIEPARCHVGVRIKRSSPATQPIQSLLSQFFLLETLDVIGVREPSDHRRNAFGARHFQPHVTLIRPDNGLGRDLKEIGTAFRAALEGIRFDRFVVKCRSHAVEDRS
jgi:hypothetical protein